MQPNIENLQEMLAEVGKIREKHEEIARLKGEGFNIFDIFRTNENKHSDFIVALLNPKGTHAQGGKFLELFLDVLVKHNIIDNKLAYQNAEVRREVSLSGNGRLDILLKASNGTIYIENKIWASDQNEQVKRYHNAGKDKINFKLLYLTPDEHKSESAGGLIVNKDYFPISYKTHIIEWLEFCHKETANLPILRETIKQYIIHLNHLTGQAQNNEMAKELYKVINDNFEEAQMIAGNFEEAKVQILNEVVEIVEEKLENICKAKNLIYNGFKTPNRNVHGFHISTDFLESNKLKIGFEFEYPPCSEMYFGLIDKGVSEDMRNKLVEVMRTKFGIFFREPEPDWVVWETLPDESFANWNPYGKTSKENEQFAEDFVNKVMDIVDKTLEIVGYLIPEK